MWGCEGGRAGLLLAGAWQVGAQPRRQTGRQTGESARATHSRTQAHPRRQRAQLTNEIAVLHVEPRQVVRCVLGVVAAWGCVWEGCVCGRAGMGQGGGGASAGGRVGGLGGPRALEGAPPAPPTPFDPRPAPGSATLPPLPPSLPPSHQTHKHTPHHTHMSSYTTYAVPRASLLLPCLIWRMAPYLPKISYI